MYVCTPIFHKPPHIYTMNASGNEVSTLEVTSSNLMEYPTSSPSSTSISSETLLATDMAATRRGCVHPIIPSVL